MKTAKPQNIALYIIIVFVFTVINSCASKQNSFKNSTIEETNPKLIFLNYSISEDNNRKKNIQFINKIITDGKLKNNIYDDSVFGDLTCNQLDENLNVLQSITIKNPLIKTFEYVNDSKQFETKIVELKNTEFSLKLKLEANTKYITINEITPSSTEKKSLIKTKINSL